jgi:hypothetical protein
MAPATADPALEEKGAAKPFFSKLVRPEMPTINSKINS